MKSKAEQIYEAIGEGYGYNGSKDKCIEVIESILNSDTPANKTGVNVPVIGSFPCRFCDRTFTDEYELEAHVNRNHNQFSARL